jgi:hypothetical protein
MLATAKHQHIDFNDRRHSLDPARTCIHKPNGLLKPYLPVMALDAQPLRIMLK